MIHMSVLTKKKIYSFRAPLSIGSSKVTVSGSWSAASPVMPMEPTELLKMRIHTWKQQHDSSVSDVCMDWIITHNSGTEKHTLVLQTNDPLLTDCLQDEVFGNHIQKFLDQNAMIIIPMAHTFNNCTRGHV